MSPDKFRVLIVDDEPSIQSLVKRYFEKNGFAVSCAGSGSEMRAILNIHPVQLVILDISLPDEDGFSLLEEIRTGCSMGVIMLTAKAELNDRLAGLNSGADDYLPKPFERSELMARSKAVLRRFSPTIDANPNRYNYSFGKWNLNTRTHQLTDKNDRLIDLSPAEYQLLLVFITYPRIVLSRDYLLQQTRGRPSSPFDRTIDVRVGKLRKKLNSDEYSKPLFETIRGAGYLLNSDVLAI